MGREGKRLGRALRVGGRRKLGMVRGHRFAGPMAVIGRCPGQTRSRARARRRGPSRGAARERSSRGTARKGELGARTSWSRWRGVQGGGSRAAGRSTGSPAVRVSAVVPWRRGLGNPWMSCCRSSNSGRSSANAGCAQSPGNRSRPADDGKQFAAGRRVSIHCISRQSISGKSSRSSEAVPVTCCPSPMASAREGRCNGPLTLCGH